MFLDLRYAVRQLWRSPEWTVVALLTLATGIACSASVFSILDAALAGSSSFPDSSRVVRLWQDIPELGSERMGISAPEVLAYSTRTRSFDAFAGYGMFYLDALIDGRPERVAALRSNAALFQIVGARPLIGRFFTSADEAQEQNLAVLSYGYWVRRFARETTVLGRTIQLNDRPYIIIGVLPDGLDFPSTALSVAEDPPDLWIPLVYSQKELAARSGTIGDSVIARLAKGVTMTQADTDVQRVARDLVREYPQFYQGKSRLSATVEPWGLDQQRRLKPTLVLVTASVAVFLFLACANVIGLLLARSEARQREFAIRAALGASNGRLARLALVESVLLSAIAGAIGCVLAFALAGIVGSVETEQFSLQGVSLGWKALLFSLFLSLLLGVICGLAPSLHRSRRPSRGGLLGRRGSFSSDGSRRGALVVAQVACTVVLLTCVGLLGGSLIRVLNTPLGYEPNGMYMVRAAFNRTRYPGAAERHQAQRAIVERLATIPGVKEVGLTTNLPLAYPKPIRYHVFGDDPYAPRMGVAELVDSGYFGAMGIRLVEGRAFNSTDGPSGAPSAVINQTMALKHWPGRSAIGQQIVWANRRLTIVGVVGDVREKAIDAVVEPAMYMSIYQTESAATLNGIFVLRTYSDNVDRLGDAVRRAVWSVDPNLVLNQEARMRDLVSESLRTRRLLLGILAGCGAGSLFLALIGVYGVLSYAVVRRRSEIGVRLALGSSPSRVIALFLNKALVMTAKGLVIGLVASLGVANAMSGFLYGISPTEPTVLVITSALILAASAFSAYWPARRASRLNPMVTLRET